MPAVTGWAQLSVSAQLRSRGHLLLPLGITALQSQVELGGSHLASRFTDDQAKDRGSTLQARPGTDTLPGTNVCLSASGDLIVPYCTTPHLTHTFGDVGCCGPGNSNTTNVHNALREVGSALLRKNHSA